MFANAGFTRRMAASSAAIVVLASLAVSASAMRVSPMVSELTTSGAGSTARVEVGNVGTAALPFETLLTRMEVDSDGNIVEPPGDEEFLVFPPQGLVPVGGRQVVRVQWVGPASLDASQAYYLWVRQLPVDIEPNPETEMGAAAIQVLYTMKALIVVAPPGAEPKIELVSAVPAIITPTTPDLSDVGGTVEQVEPTTGVEIVVRNTGRRYALMSGANWTIEGTDVSGQPFAQSYTGDEISQSVGVGYVQPLNGTRKFQLPTSVALDGTKPIKVKFS